MATTAAATAAANTTTTAAAAAANATTTTAAASGTGSTYCTFDLSVGEIQLDGSKLTYAEAVEACNDKGKDLPSLHDEVLADSFIGHLDEECPLSGGGNLTSSDHLFWVGMTAGSDDPVWHDGTAYTEEEHGALFEDLAFLGASECVAAVATSYRHLYTHQKCAETAHFYCLEPIIDYSGGVSGSESGIGVGTGEVGFGSGFGFEGGSWLSFGEKGYAALVVPVVLWSLSLIAAVLVVVSMLYMYRRRER